MQKRKWRWRTLGVLRKLLSYAIGSIGLLVLLYAHQQEIGMVGEEQSWIVELVPPHLPRAPLPPSKVFCIYHS
ncbi:hypothetical protein CsSME_00052384 [Camellia sinensis var. sinensis]